VSEHLARCDLVTVDSIKSSVLRIEDTCLSEEMPYVTSYCYGLHDSTVRNQGIMEDSETDDTEELTTLFDPYPGELIEAYPISKKRSLFAAYS